jgi:CRP-like cAMP-binding protein
MPDEPYDFLRGVPLFADVSDKDLRTIASSMRRRTFADGEHIVSEGEGGVGFFFVEQGALAVSKDGVTVARLAPGDHFGEIALLTGSERTATIVATTQLRCFGMTPWDFKPLVEGNPTIAWKLLQSLAQKLG